MTRAEYQREWKKRNPGKGAEYNRRYRERNPDYGRQYREANAEKVRSKYRRWYEANREAVLKKNRERAMARDEVDPGWQKAYLRAYYESHKEEIKARVQKYRQDTGYGKIYAKRRSAKVQAARRSASVLCKDCGASISITSRRGVFRERCDTCAESHYRERRAEWAAAHPEAIRDKERRRRARLAGRPVERVSRLAVFDRDGWRCMICGRSTPRAKMGTRNPCAPELDHRVPIAAGGSHTWDNVQCACRRCNQKKGDRANTGQMPLWHKPPVPPSGEED